MVVYCFPSKLKQYELVAEGSYGDKICITFDRLITLFEENICSDFLIYFKNNITQFEYFFKEKDFDVEKYKLLLETINEIM